MMTGEAFIEDQSLNVLSKYNLLIQAIMGIIIDSECGKKKQKLDIVVGMTMLYDAAVRILV